MIEYLVRSVQFLHAQCPNAISGKDKKENIWIQD